MAYLLGFNNNIRCIEMVEKEQGFKYSDGLITT